MIGGAPPTPKHGVGGVVVSIVEPSGLSEEVSLRP